MVFEALRILAEAGFQPRDTLEFHFYAGEEGGLLGSQDIFKSYKSAGKQVLAMVNQDMAGYSPSGVISIYTDYVDSGLTTYVRRVAEGYTGLKTSTDACGYGCSDHHSAYSNGFRTSLTPHPITTLQVDDPLLSSFCVAASAYVCDEVISSSSPYIHSASDVSIEHLRMG